MDENALRDMLERATREEPAMGRLPLNALREGVRLRRRRRTQSAATAVAAAIAVVGIVPALTSHGKIATSASGTAYLATYQGKVVPISLATDTAGQSIHVPEINIGSMPIAAPANGRTLYVSSPAGLITPIDTATNKAGPSINLHAQTLGDIAVAPNGTTAYVIAATGIIPVDLATRRAQGLIRTPTATSVVVAPNDKFAYVLTAQDVIPIRVATNTGLRPILVPSDSGIVFSPDGRTAYALSQGLGELIPISTTTNAVGKPIHLGGTPFSVVSVPGSGLAYVLNLEHFIVPVDLTTRTVGRPIEAGPNANVLNIAPDGKAVYVFTVYIVRGMVEWQVTEISTARGAVIGNIRINRLQDGPFAISPDGSTGFVVTCAGNTSITCQLVPIRLANNKVGRPIQLGYQQPAEIVFAR